MSATTTENTNDIRLGVLDEAGQSVLFTDARTANSFADIAVTDEELASIWDLAKWPPTAINAQPLRVTFVRTDEGKQRLLPHIAEFNKAKTSSAPVVAVLSVDTRFHEHLPRVFPMNGEAMRDNMESNKEMHASTTGFSGALQAAYFIMAVRARGLAAGPMQGFDPAGIDAEFFPDGRNHTVLVVNIGHPGEAAWYPRLPRLDNDEVLTWA